jgi:hypothetical protein
MVTSKRLKCSKHGVYLVLKVWWLEAVPIEFWECPLECGYVRANKHQRKPVKTQRARASMASRAPAKTQAGESNRRRKASALESQQYLKIDISRPADDRQLHLF